jgi:deoxyhypusine synthase
MITINEQKFFTQDDFEQRSKTVQRAINLMTDPEKFDRFNLEMNQFIDKFEKKHGTNEKVTTYA